MRILTFLETRGYSASVTRPAPQKAMASPSQNETDVFPNLERRENLGMEDEIDKP